MKDWKLYAIVMLAVWCIALTCKLELQPSASASSPESAEVMDIADTPPVLDHNGTNLLWTADKGQRLSLDCYCKIAPQVSGSNYSVLQRCRMTFAANGLLEKAELLPERTQVQARCRQMTDDERRNLRLELRRKEDEKKRKLLEHTASKMQ